MKLKEDIISKFQTSVIVLLLLLLLKTCKVYTLFLKEGSVCYFFFNAS